MIGQARNRRLFAVLFLMFMATCYGQMCKCTWDATNRLCVTKVDGYECSGNPVQVCLCSLSESEIDCTQNNGHKSCTTLMTLTTNCGYRDVGSGRLCAASDNGISCNFNEICGCNQYNYSPIAGPQYCAGNDAYGCCYGFVSEDAEYGDIIRDPHFKGFDGLKFDRDGFHGIRYDKERSLLSC